jgi:hypothetical protein
MHCCWFCLFEHACERVRACVSACVRVVFALVRVFVCSINSTYLDVKYLD